MCVLVIGKIALSGQDVKKAGFEFVEAINVDPTHFGAYKCKESEKNWLNWEIIKSEKLHKVKTSA